ncbi:hypothetical protein [Chitinophaga sp.]|uniref:hypothetical protein n=1 Tax=Chitinophaga sp. TaxID=1869181 RepID=UPI002603B313|nr:hypothetical protein [uncultured Chitinophaga sp.]
MADRHEDKELKPDSILMKAAAEFRSLLPQFQRLKPSAICGNPALPFGAPKAQPMEKIVLPAH